MALPVTGDGLFLFVQIAEAVGCFSSGGKAKTSTIYIPICEASVEVRVTLATKAYWAAREKIQACNSQIDHYADAEINLHVAEQENYLEGVTARLYELVEQAISATEIVYELLDLTQALRSFKQGLRQFKGEFAKVQYHDEYFGPHVQAVDFLASRLSLIAPLVLRPSDLEQERNILLRMLRQFPHYLEERATLPKNEKNVQDDLVKVLRLAFPDVIREPSVAKQTKTYHPDFGIESIKTAVEVKFVNEKKLAATAIGALYEDMQGYANSDYSTFVAFVYMTGNFLTQEQVDAELLRANANKSWSVVVVVGGTDKLSKAKMATKKQPSSAAA